MKLASLCFLHAHSLRSDSPPRSVALGRAVPGGYQAAYVLPLPEASAAVRTAAGALCAGRRRRSATSTHGVATAACKPTGANRVAAAALGPAQRLASRGGWRGEQPRRPRGRERRGARLQRRVPARLCRLGRQRCEQQGEPPCSSRPRSEQLCPSSAGGRGLPRRAARGEAAAAAARAAIRAEGSGGACAGSGPQRTLRPRLAGPRAGAVAVRALFLTRYWMRRELISKRRRVGANGTSHACWRKRRARGRNAAKTCARGSFGGFRNYHRPAVAGIAAHDLR